MKRKTIIGTAIFAAFLMLSAMVFITPVTAQIAYEPDAEETDLDITEILNGLTNSIESCITLFTANEEVDILLQKIQNNRQVQELVNQIKNTENPEEKYLL